MATLKIKGFKCFADDDFEINRLTVLTGANGAGKSSVIQILLLIRQAIEKCAFFVQEQNMYDIKEWRESDVILNGEYCLNLGSYDDIINNNVENISVSIDGTSFEFVPAVMQDGVLRIGLDNENETTLPEYMTSKEFYYLNAERLGPRYHYEYKYNKFDNCGFYGELTAKVLLNNAFTRISKEKWFSNEGPDNFKIQVDKWLEYICPGINVTVESLGLFLGQVKLRNQMNSVSSVAPNIGFGISYVLPIIVDGLLGDRGKMLIVENPEAHLHPKAQSNLGFFLGKMASSGLTVIIETHSEHIVNGIRRAALSKLGLSPDDVNIYFFDNSNRNIEVNKIKIDNEGNLTDFPTDFFDQVRQDMLEIIKLAAD
ncbi:AAA family ATPase [Bacteroides caecigallinarum]|uniref:AAA family ATPase n=1 Tax=Bacteroides caecigallinarum TaxID=1411144 RepID=UPI00195C08B0|nr:DUF3696 domain-containing protein [Bacteroides caecigallinarum]MBM6889446.1 DUF3696 domain-containing protein [Bacteroides caecigallinarum]MCF2552365.1 DUF3696 domain-containing protein [Bacteroides caecigallinarum]